MNTIIDLPNLLHKKETLHPELSSCVIQENGWTLLKHPLVYSVPYFPEMNAVLNAQFKAKNDHLAKALEEKDWGQYIFIHERPYRINAFEEIKDKISDNEYWDLLGTIWTDSENIWQWPVNAADLLNDTRPGKQKMMSEDEFDFLNSLPNEIVVYRGHQAKNKSGFSWTLSYWHACWFSQRLTRGHDKTFISRGICRKEDVNALLMGRGEYEIIIDPSKISKRKVFDHSFSGEFSKIEKLAKSVFTLGDKSHHGIWHWKKVDMNAVALAKQTKGADAYVCRLFSILHDCCRENENSDPEHGERASQFVNKLHANGELNISITQRNILMEACSLHNKGETSSNPTIGCCWDADRMDLIRVGKDPEEKYFSTDAAKEFLWKI